MNKKEIDAEIKKIFISLFKLKKNTQLLTIADSSLNKYY